MQAFTKIEGAPTPVGPYSAAVKAKGFVFCSGQIGLSPQTGEIVGSTVDEQAVQVFKNIDAVLEAAGSSFSRAVMVTIFLADIAHGRRVNELYSAHVNLDYPPARQTLAVKDLPLGALIEVSVIAEAD